jgi:hypothetical protein
MRSSLRGFCSGGFVVSLLAFASLAVLSTCPPPQPNPSGLVTVHYHETANMQLWNECYTGIGYSGPSSFAAYDVTEIDNNQPHAVDFTLRLSDIYASTDPTAAHNQDVPGIKGVKGNWFSNCNSVAILPTGSDLTVKAGTVVKPATGTEVFIVGLSPTVETGPDATALLYNFALVPGLHILMQNDSSQYAPYCNTSSNASHPNSFVCFVG